MNLCREYLWRKRLKFFIANPHRDARNDIAMETPLTAAAAGRTKTVIEVTLFIGIRPVW